MATLLRFKAALIVVAAVFIAGIAGVIVAAPGGIPGKPGGGEEGAANNLSFPVIFAESATVPIPSIVPQGSYALDGEYWLYDGVSLCDPNDATCTLDPNATITRVYVQKDPLNNWQAYSAANLVPGVLTALPVDFMDVGDNLESVPWRTTSVVRVEFVPFAFTGVGAIPALSGFEMVFVSGQGIDEVWGVHATNSASDPAAIPEDLGVGTLYSGCMALSLTKLELGAGSIDVAPDPAAYSWDAANKVWQNTAQTTKIYPFTAEINVKGRVIYGYNWMLKKQLMDTGVLKEGWWRLTFYSECPGLSPLDFTDLTEKYDPTAPASEEEAEAEPGSGTYPRVPFVDVGNDLTYIDIYIQARSSGGGGGGKGGGKGGGNSP